MVEPQQVSTTQMPNKVRATIWGVVSCYVALAMVAVDVVLLVLALLAFFAAGFKDTENNMASASRFITTLRYGMAGNVVGIVLAIFGFSQKGKWWLMLLGVLLNVLVILGVIFVLNFTQRFVWIRG
jgi:hypothetical protein